MRGFLTWMALCAVCVASANGFHAKGRVLPDLPQHLEYAREEMEHGNFQNALAHLSLVLLDRPIRYRVQFDHVEKNQRPVCLAAVRDAVALWKSAFGTDVLFVEVGPKDEAEVTVNFQPDVKDDGVAVGGHVDWTRQVLLVGGIPEGDMHADIHIRAYLPSGSRMSLEQMRHSASHEFGHVLGLDDSPYVGDIMGPLDLRHPVSVFAATELDYLREVREQAEELRSQTRFRRAALLIDLGRSVLGF